MDNTDEIADFHEKNSIKQQTKMLLLMAGITDFDKVEYADDGALNSLLVDIFISTEYRKLLQYLRR
jgi:hypothetical protein